MTTFLCIAFFVIYIVTVLLYIYYQHISYKKFKYDFNPFSSENFKSSFFYQNLFFFTLLHVMARNDDTINFKRVQSLIEKSGVSPEIYLDQEKYMKFIEDIQNNKISISYDSVNKKYVFNEGI